MVKADDQPFALSKSNLIVGLGWARLCVLAVIYLSLLLVQILQGLFLHLSIWQTLNLFMMGAFAIQLGIAESKTDDARSLFLKTAFFYDVTALLGLMAATSANHSVFLFMFLVYAAGAGLVFGKEWALKLALYTVVGLNLLLAAHWWFEPAAMKGSAVLSAVSLLIIVGLSGLLGDQIRTAGESLEIKEQEIKALTDINEIIVDNIPSGIVTLNERFRVIKANRGAAKLFEDLAIEGRQLEDIFPELQEPISSAAQGAKSFTRVELGRRSLSGERMIVEAIIAPIRDRAEHGPSWIVLLQNLTEIRQLEAAMRQKEKLAAVGQLAAGIAHEIRNPLASISGSVQLLSGTIQSQTEEDKKLLAIVIKEIDRLNHLITEFLDFVRPDVKLDDPVNVNQLIRELIEIVKHNKNIPKNIEHQVRLESAGIIHGHYDKLKQAMLNILINAYQAMATTLHPRLSVATVDIGDKVVISIEDNGIGMTPDTVKRIFEPFHTTKPQGTGLGLAITHKIIESHQGEILVESELGRGTIFKLSFPAVKGPRGDEAESRKQA